MPYPSSCLPHSATRLRLHPGLHAWRLLRTAMQYPASWWAWVIHLVPYRWPFRASPVPTSNRGAGTNRPLLPVTCAGHGGRLFSSVTLLTNTSPGGSTPGSHWRPWGLPLLKLYPNLPPYTYWGECPHSYWTPGFQRAPEELRRADVHQLSNSMSPQRHVAGSRGPAEAQSSPSLCQPWLHLVVKERILGVSSLYRGLAPPLTRWLWATNQHLNRITKGGGNTCPGAPHPALGTPAHLSLPATRFKQAEPPQGHPESAASSSSEPESVVGKSGARTPSRVLALAL